MTVHAHPDDEASSTGGLLALSAARGIQTVLVTCTDGALGDDLSGAKPNTPGHDRQRVVATRRRELAASCSILEVSAQVSLGYADSGMMGWPENEAPGSFWSMDVEEAARPLVQLMEQYRPDVVVTYDVNGFYGHPDHIQAHRITIAAADATGIPARIYFPTIPRSRVARFAEAVRELLHAAGDPDADEFAPTEEFGTPDDEVTVWLDCSTVIEQKRRALLAHASQAPSTPFMELAPERFGELFGAEAYVRLRDTAGPLAAEHDLFAALS